MKNWPALISNALGRLHLAAIEDTSKLLPASPSHTTNLLDAVIRLQEQNRGVKVATNFALAALYMGSFVKASVLQGHTPSFQLYSIQGNFDVTGSPLEILAQQSVHRSRPFFAGSCPCSLVMNYSYLGPWKTRLAV